MQPLKAHVYDGRLMLDEPTDLPEGEVVYLQPMEGRKHLYYRYSHERDELIVLAVWGAPRGRGPKS